MFDLDYTAPFRQKWQLKLNYMLTVNEHFTTTAYGTTKSGEEKEPGCYFIVKSRGYK